MSRCRRLSVRTWMLVTITASMSVTMSMCSRGTCLSSWATEGGSHCSFKKFAYLPGRDTAGSSRSGRLRVKSSWATDKGFGCTTSGSPRSPSWFGARQPDQQLLARSKHSATANFAFRSWLLIDSTPNTHNVRMPGFPLHQAILDEWRQRVQEHMLKEHNTEAT